MKRIPSKIALSNVLAGVTGKQKIKIVDYENEHDLSMERNGKTVFEGEEVEIYGWQNSKYMDSEYYGMRIDGDTIVFKIFTKFEQYK